MLKKNWNGVSSCFVFKIHLHLEFPCDLVYIVFSYSKIKKNSRHFAQCFPNELISYFC